MKYFIAFASLVCASALAEGPRLGLEYELEKDRKTRIRNHAVTLQPGWEFAKDNPLNLVELLIDHNEDERASDDGSRARETKLFLRLRHKRSLTENFSYYLRGGVGRSFNNEHSFNFAYIEPGLKYELNARWEWTLGVRFGDALNGKDGERVRKYITGPSFALDKRNELEFRYVRAHGDDDAWSLALGYVHRF